jgi:hypothetical protein
MMPTGMLAAVEKCRVREMATLFADPTKITQA